MSNIFHSVKPGGILLVFTCVDWNHKYLLYYHTAAYICSSKLYVECNATLRLCLHDMAMFGGQTQKNYYPC